MSDQFNKLRKTVLTEVIKRKMEKEATPTRHPELLGEFVAACLRRKHMLPEDLARTLGVKPVLITLLLEGDIPEWMLNDELLDRLANALDYEANIFRIMAGRDFTPTEFPEEDRIAIEGKRSSKV